MFPDYLADRIRDAATWYGESLRDGGTFTVLRSPELKPTFSFFEVFKMCQSVESVAKYQAALVGDVCLRRNIKVQERFAGKPLSAGNTTGRILVLDAFSSTYDSLAADSSGGFFDESDCPPWNFWIDYEFSIAEASPRHVRGVLSAWIPEEFFDIVDEAILVSGGEALCWGSEKHAGLDAASIGTVVEQLGRTVFAA